MDQHSFDTEIQYKVAFTGSCAALLVLAGYLLFAAPLVVLFIFYVVGALIMVERVADGVAKAMRDGAINEERRGVATAVFFIVLLAWPAALTLGFVAVQLIRARRRARASRDDQADPASE
jgi:hypothetical protein